MIANPGDRRGFWLGFWTGAGLASLVFIVDLASMAIGVIHAVIAR